MRTLVLLLLVAFVATPQPMNLTTRWQDGVAVVEWQQDSAARALIRRCPLGHDCFTAYDAAGVAGDNRVVLSSVAIGDIFKVCTVVPGEPLRCTGWVTLGGYTMWLPAVRR